MTPILKADGLCQGYSRREVITDLDLELTGGRVGLLGPNGAGKTTLLRTLATVEPPRAGRLDILGIEINSARAVRHARRKIGWLPQQFGYFPAFTVEDFVRYIAWLRELPEATAGEATDRAIRSAGLIEHKRTKLRKLSGGMIRRCGIAQAIVGSPPLIILDEPTVGLDPAQRVQFREMLRGLDGAVLLSTHLVEDVAAVCDQVIVLGGGRIVFTGTAPELAAAAAPGAPGDNDLERGYTTVLAHGALAA